MKRVVPPIASGLLFGAGLALGGMTNPRRVRGFLDLFGDWDPTLVFVMGGAVLVMAIAWRIRERMKVPLFGEKFSLPDRSDLDPELIAGAALFGIGWGLAGLCPGPAVAGLVFGLWQPWLFFAALLAGMFAHRLLTGR